MGIYTSYEGPLSPPDEVDNILDHYTDLQAFAAYLLVNGIEDKHLAPLFLAWKYEGDEEAPIDLEALSEALAGCEHSQVLLACEIAKFIEDNACNLMDEAWSKIEDIDEDALSSALHQVEKYI